MNRFGRREDFEVFYAEGGHPKLFAKGDTSWDAPDAERRTLHGVGEKLLSLVIASNREKLSAPRSF